MQGASHWRGNHRRSVWQARVLEEAVTDMISVDDRSDRATISRAASEYINHWPASSEKTRRRHEAWDARGLSWKNKRKLGKKWSSRPRPRVPQEVVDSIKDVYFCERCNTTITKMAEILGLSREYVSDIINGKVRNNE